MTRAPFSANDITTAINTAARRMTSAPPSSELHARVMSKIDAPQPRWGWRLAIAGGAIASVAIVVAIQLASPAAPGLVSPKPPQEVVSSAAEAKPTATTIASSPVLSMASASGAATSRTVFAPSAGQLEWRARAVQALEQPAALVVEPLDATRQQIEPIDITPLSVAPLTVPVLNSGGRQ